MPLMAATVFQFAPCASTSVENAITIAPITVVVTGSQPVRMAGMMKRTITRKVAASPTSDHTPRHRPTSATSAANATTSTHNASVRERSAM